MRGLSPITIGVGLLAMLSLALAIRLLWAPGDLVELGQARGGNENDKVSRSEGLPGRASPGRPRASLERQEVRSPLPSLPTTERATEESNSTTSHVGAPRMNHRMSAASLRWSATLRPWRRYMRARQQADEAAFATLKLGQEIRDAIRNINRQEILASHRWTNLVGDGASASPLPSALVQPEAERLAVIDGLLGPAVSQAFFAEESSSISSREDELQKRLNSAALKDETLTHSASDAGATGLAGVPADGSAAAPINTDQTPDGAG